MSTSIEVVDYDSATMYAAKNIMALPQIAVTNWKHYVVISWFKIYFILFAYMKSNEC